MDLSLPGVMPAVVAILGDGYVVNWGNADYGGDSSAVQEQLKSRSSLLVVHLAAHSPQSCVMDLWSLGVSPSVVVPAVRCRSS